MPSLMARTVAAEPTAPLGRPRLSAENTLIPGRGKLLGPLADIAGKRLKPGMPAGNLLRKRGVPFRQRREEIHVRQRLRAPAILVGTLLQTLLRSTLTKRKMCFFSSQPHFLSLFVGRPSS